MGGTGKEETEGGGEEARKTEVGSSSHLDESFEIPERWKEHGLHL